MWNYAQEIQDWLSEHPDGVIVVTGPTASGKTGVSISLAQSLGNGEVINADSRQIYTDLTVLTAAPTEEEQDRVPHHLFEYISPEQTYNVSEWRDDALEKIAEIQQRGNTPILCGGTGLWIDALTKNFTLGVEPNEELRKELNEKTCAELYTMLKEKDMKAAEVLGENNKKYIIRALEICDAKGSKTETSVQEKPLYPFFFVGTTWKREVLYSRINKRTDIMFDMGVLNEVETFLEKYPNAPESDSAFIAHGVPECIAYFAGEKTLEEVKEKMAQNTRNYAKRQLTWWRKDERVRFLDMETGEEISLHDTEY